MLLLAVETIFDLGGLLLVMAAFALFIKASEKLMDWLDGDDE